ncbi:uncharacterized protein K452DRAFT_337952 [Aplosporella prunicola CBS 121167]|uniref:Uncharacterized protein n=1 Tax=Aplosporella prunicola CBS 121167 TaxID=1176127 RepID=A0A6A6B4F5_9PEZI|nr:uncharacterized protein K452DRAFT_337952 [Aplosporella prunicola CBS 121167]KAF2139089.1 hypothetical protein K452DRAFT_337952 [Aplosporella prunicola CBS 121167]
MDTDIAAARAAVHALLPQPDPDDGNAGIEMTPMARPADPLHEAPNTQAQNPEHTGEERPAVATVERSCQARTENKQKKKKWYRQLWCLHFANDDDSGDNTTSTTNSNNSDADAAAYAKATPLLHDFRKLLLQDPAAARAWITQQRALVNTARQTGVARRDGTGERELRALWGAEWERDVSPGREMQETAAQEEAEATTATSTGRKGRRRQPSEAWWLPGWEEQFGGVGYRDVIAGEVEAIEAKLRELVGRLWGGFGAEREEVVWMELVWTLCGFVAQGLAEAEERKKKMHVFGSTWWVGVGRRLGLL